MIQHEVAMVLCYLNIGLLLLFIWKEIIPTVQHGDHAETLIVICNIMY